MSSGLVGACFTPDVTSELLFDREVRRIGLLKVGNKMGVFGKETVMGEETVRLGESPRKLDGRGNLAGINLGFAGSFTSVPRNNLHLFYLLQRFPPMGGEADVPYMQKRWLLPFATERCHRLIVLLTSSF